MKTRIKAIVSMFGKRKLCFVDAYGEALPEYPRERMLWVERAEDMYAQPHYVEPYCILERGAWIRGEDVK